MCEYIIENMLLPGKVEQWVVFFDMCHEWLTLTMADFTRIIDVLCSNYPERLYQVFVFRPPLNIDTLYNHYTPKLGLKTQQKIIIERSKLPQTFFRYVCGNQLERRYGGLAMNVKYFWPPYVPPGSVRLETTSTQIETPTELLISKYNYTLDDPGFSD